MAEAALTDKALAAAAGFKLVKSGSGYVYKPLATSQYSAKLGIKKALRVLDEQNAVQRFEWKNLPSGLTGALIERMLYYRGQLCLFELNGEFYCLPYAPIGPFDVYGRPGKIQPLVFAGPNQTGEKKDKDKPFIIGFTREAAYSEKSLSPECAVILRDYTQQLPDRIIPRAELMDSTIDLMSDCFPLARTQLIANSGVKGMRVDSQDAKDEVVQASEAIYDAALRGLAYVPILGRTEFQDFSASALNVQDYLLDMQALDNFRLSLHGLSSGGLFEKKAQTLKDEAEINAGRAKSALQDSYAQRQAFCELANKAFGLSVSCEISESALEPSAEESYEGKGVKEVEEDGGQPIQDAD